MSFFVANPCLSLFIFAAFGNMPILTTVKAIHSFWSWVLRAFSSFVVWAVAEFTEKESSFHLSNVYSSFPTTYLHYHSFTTLLGLVFFSEAYPRTSHWVIHLVILESNSRNVPFFRLRNI
eukprot:Lithocolla_globosa_v1_NODE_8029_length_870_cov_19.194595.p2 type:complete len:120 gc:universal NODE_8029_length_870_cov_19.194595:305-664(+)